MKRTLLLLPAIACLSLSVFAQVPVDKTVSLQSVEIQGKRFGGLTGGEVKRLQVDSNLSGLTGTTADVFRLLPSVVTDIEGGINVPWFPITRLADKRSALRLAGRV
ncbi:MAG: hypothetical protein ACLR6J_17210 [Parabacteroides merdae]